MKITGTVMDKLENATTTGFSLPTNGQDAEVRWFKNWPTLSQVMIVKLVSRDADVVTCQILSTADGSVAATAKIDLTDLDRVWRYLPSTIDAANVGECAVLCIGQKWFDENNNAAKTFAIGKQPWGSDEFADALLTIFANADRTRRADILKLIFADKDQRDAAKSLFDAEQQHVLSQAGVL